MKTLTEITPLEKQVRNLFQEVSIVEIVKHIRGLNPIVNKTYEQSYLALFFVRIEEAYIKKDIEQIQKIIGELFEKGSLDDYMTILQVGLMALYGVMEGEEERSIPSLEVAETILIHNSILSFVVFSKMFCINEHKPLNHGSSSN